MSLHAPLIVHVVYAFSVGGLIMAVLVVLNTNITAGTNFFSGHT